MVHHVGIPSIKELREIRLNRLSKVAPPTAGHRLVPPDGMVLLAHPEIRMMKGLHRRRRRLFADHTGIDFNRMSALITNIKAASYVQGASTIAAGGAHHLGAKTMYHVREAVGLQDEQALSRSRSRPVSEPDLSGQRRQRTGPPACDTSAGCNDLNLAERR